MLTAALVRRCLFWTQPLASSTPVGLTIPTRVPGVGQAGVGQRGPSLPAHRCQLFSQAAGRDGLVPSCPPRLTLLRASAPPGWGGHPCSGSRLFPAALAWLRGDLVGGWGEGKTLNRLFPNEVWRQLERGRILLFSCLLLSPARGGGDVYPRFLCWFAASSVSFLCRPQSVLARFRFLCSQLSAQREKGKNKRVGGVGGMVAGRKPSRSPWPGQRSVGMGTGATFALRTKVAFVASFSSESLALLWPPLLQCIPQAPFRFAGKHLLVSRRGRLEKTSFIPPPEKCGMKH